MKMTMMVMQKAVVVMIDVVNRSGIIVSGGGGYGR